MMKMPIICIVPMQLQREVYKTVHEMRTRSTLINMHDQEFKVYKYTPEMRIPFIINQERVLISGVLLKDYRPGMTL